MSKVLLVVGPTASGKSAAAVKLAGLFNGEIINGDSIQVYRELNIGSAKTTADQMDGIVHHLIDYKDIEDEYNVQVFQKDGRKCIKDIEDRGKLPIVSGGTGLYIKALIYDYSFTEMEPSHDEYQGVSTEELYERLRNADPVSLQKIHPNNRRRIVRALQMAESGHLKSEQETWQKHEPLYDCLIIGLTLDRVLLTERINQRVDTMMKEGLLEEVISVSEKYGWNRQGLQGIGYKEFREFLEGKQTIEETTELIKIHTRQFAKRQYTWWNNQMPVKWYDITEENYLERIIDDVRNWLNE